MYISRILTAVALIALVVTVVLLVEPAVAQTLTRPAPVRGAPGPIAGAGLVTVVVGAGAYWLFRRFRKTS
jgi:hypothetical protein